MISYIEESLFQIKAQTFVNPVNTVGTMDGELSKYFKEIFPQMFSKYKALCEIGKLTIGRLHLFKTSDKWVVNFPTRIRDGEASKIEYIEQGLSLFEPMIAKYGITSIAFPCIGCGNDEGLDWENVKKRIEKRLKKLDIPIYIYETVPDPKTQRVDQELIKKIRFSCNKSCSETHDSILIR
jgi:O-acetyl-ADP-ribose deacetylase (regulator of RNase III)